MIQKRLASISVTSAALHAALVSLILTYPAAALMRFLQGYDPQRTVLAPPTPWWETWVVFPVGLAVILTVVGTVSTVLFCLAYNLSARLLGGVRYTEVSSDPGKVREPDTDAS